MAHDANIGKPEKQLIKAQEILPGGLTKKENDVLNKYILGKRSRCEDEGGSSNEESEIEESKQVTANMREEDYIDEMQLMIYGSVATEE